MIVLTRPWWGPLLVLGSKGQGWTLNFALFPHNNSIIFGKDTLCMCCLWPKEDLHWYWGKEVKGQGQISPFDIQWWYFTRVDHNPRRTSIHFGEKRSNSDFQMNCSRTITPLPFDIQITMIVLHTCVDHYPRTDIDPCNNTMYLSGVALYRKKKNLYWFWGQKVNYKGQIWTLNFSPFPHKNSIAFWHWMMILHSWVDQAMRRTSIGIGVKRSSSNGSFQVTAFVYGCNPQVVWLSWQLLFSCLNFLSNYNLTLHYLSILGWNWQ